MRKTLEVRHPPPVRSSRSARGFTLVELVVVIAIIGVLLGVLGVRTGAFGFWRDEGFLRRLSETMALLNRQALIDGAFYRIEFQFREQRYRVERLNITQTSTPQTTIGVAGSAATLSDELNRILSPAIGRTQTFSPPDDFPSLAEPVEFPRGLSVTRVKTARGEVTPDDAESAYILFSPRGFSEFAVLNIQLSDGRPVTIAVNPFTGLARVYRDERDFEWEYGRASLQ